MADEEAVLGGVPVEDEEGVFRLRRIAHELGAAAGLPEPLCVRFAAACTEIGRDLVTAPGLRVTFELASRADGGSRLLTGLRWEGSGRPSPDSWAAVRRLLPESRLRRGRTAGAAGPAARAVLAIRVPLPRADTTVERLREVVRELRGAPAADEPWAQTRDLIAALAESEARRRRLRAVNAELEETNRGVMALYAELSAELEETNRGVVALYSQEHQFALTLQRSFLPQSVPAPVGVRLAVRYLPAASDTQIGGDFYEAVETPLGLLLAVGDVAGHDLSAAMVMGELRHGLRAYATEELRPHQLLGRLETYLLRHQPGWTATLCVALVGPDRRTVEVANAGHLPPLLLSAAGGGRLLEEHGPLLGAGLPQPSATVHRVGPGDRLLMVTDGLVEVRGQDVGGRLRVLLSAAERGPTEPEALCNELLAAFARQPEDDIAVLAALFTGP